MGWYDDAMVMMTTMMTMMMMMMRRKKTKWGREDDKLHHSTVHSPPCPAIRQHHTNHCTTQTLDLPWGQKKPTCSARAVSFPLAHIPVPALFTAATLHR